MVRRYPLSKKEKKKLISSLKSLYPGISIDKNSLIEYVEEKDVGKMIVVDGVPAFILVDDRMIPHLKYLLKHGYEWLPYVVVDMGAVKPLLNGADIMVPGIRRIVGEFGPGDIVVVVDEKYGKPFVVGTALMSSSEIEKASRGKAIRNIHRAGDKYWKML